MACVNCKEKKLKVSHPLWLHTTLLTERASSVTATYPAVKIVAAQRSVSAFSYAYSIGSWSLLPLLTDDTGQPAW